MITESPAFMRGEFVKDTREMNVADFYPTCDGKFLPRAPFKVFKNRAARGIKFLTGNPDNELIPHRDKYSADNRQTMKLNSSGCVLHKDLNTQNLNLLRYLYED